MKDKQVNFLQKLGYKVEDINYIIWHSETRSSEAYDTQHEVSIAYKVETDAIKEFKETNKHFQKAEQSYRMRPHIMHEVYKKEFDEALYEMVSSHVTQKHLKNTF